MKNKSEYMHSLIVAGLSVIPITEGAKNPHQVLGSKHDLLERGSTHEELGKWITAGVTSWAVAGGKVSGNLVTLDFDEKHYSGLYDLWYRKLSNDQKILVDTCHKSKTRNNGVHLRYRTSTPQPTMKLARKVELNKNSKKEEIVTTAETKSEGGYALIPPSAGYETTHGNLLELPLVQDEIHGEFVDTLRTFNEVEDEPATEYEWKPTDTPVGNRPGDRFNASATWEQILEPTGWVQESKNHWRRPGKKEGEGISATTDYEGRPMLYVFSSSATPFSVNKGYSKFHAFTLLNHGGDFKAAARAVTEIFPEKSIEMTKSHLWTMGEILIHDFGKEEWVIESLIPMQGMTAFSGHPGDYKTWVTIHIALCLSRNQPVFGRFPVTQGNTLIIDEEDHLRLLQKRLRLLNAKETDNIFYLSQNGIKVDDEKVRKDLVDIIKEKNIKLLILDSLVRIHQQDENDARGMAKVFNGLQEIIRAGASILFTHHHRKQTGFSSNNLGQSMRGSSDILAAVDCHILIEKKQDEVKRLVIKQTKLRPAELVPAFEITLTQDEMGIMDFKYVGDHNEKKKKAEEISDAVVLLLEDGIKSRLKIHDLLKNEFGKTAIDDGIKLAERNKSIERVPKEELDSKDRHKAYYRLPSDLPASCTPIEVENQEDNIFAV